MGKQRGEKGAECSVLSSEVKKSKVKDVKKPQSVLDCASPLALSKSSPALVRSMERGRPACCFLRPRGKPFSHPAAHPSPPSPNAPSGSPERSRW
ncbi:hypothetical protein GCM10023213_33300 [Prosthecobacter algae]|uniref:Uncharacterized protein n=1 Tax=Prosthecobacter algae TaxID=1144682 RepID=A0ABP9PBQ9_9BACT